MDKWINGKKEDKKKKINQTKHSGKAVRKYLQKNLHTKQSQTQILTLALLKVITENCPQFDEHLANNSLIKELQLLWNDPGTNPKVTDLLIQCVSVWTLEFGRTQPNHPILRFCYQVNYQINLIQTQPIYAAPPPPPHLSQHSQHISQEQVNRTQNHYMNHHNTTNNNNNNNNNEMHINRKSSLFRGWKLKRSTSNTTSTTPTPPPITVNQQQSTIATFPNSPQSPPVPPKENKGEKILSSIEESKSTSKLLNQLISENQLLDDDSLMKELYQKCQDLHAIIMKYIEETEDPVYLITKNKQENNHNNDNNGEIPKIILTEKALGKRPIRHHNDLLV
ncbi:unnamed protein product [Cunninghamella blakesleeana]